MPQQPHPSLVCKCSAEDLKVLSPVIKGGSLSAASRRLIRAPTERRVQPGEETQLSSKKRIRVSLFFIIHFSLTPNQTSESNRRPDFSQIVEI